MCTITGANGVKLNFEIRPKNTVFTPAEIESMKRSTAEFFPNVKFETHTGIGDTAFSYRVTLNTGEPDSTIAVFQKRWLVLVGSNRASEPMENLRRIAATIVSKLPQI